MRKHVYLHTSNFEYIKHLRNESSFENVHQYNRITEFPYISENEFGRIKTSQNYFHILIGHIRHEGCAWCDFPLKVISNHAKAFPFDENKFEFYCLCEQCGAKGPITYLHINDTSEEVKHEMDALILQKYQRRLSWEKCAKFKDMGEGV